MISNSRKETIFADMFNNNVDNFKESNKPIVIKFYDVTPGCEFDYFYIEPDEIKRIVSNNVGITYQNIHMVLPHMLVNHVPEHIHCYEIMHMFNTKWYTKSNEDLVFVCIYPSGLDKNPMLVQEAKEILAESFDITIYRVTTN